MTEAEKGKAGTTPCCPPWGALLPALAATNQFQFQNDAGHTCACARHSRAAALAARWQLACTAGQAAAPGSVAKLERLRESRPATTKINVMQGVMQRCVHRLCTVPS